MEETNKEELTKEELYQRLHSYENIINTQQQSIYQLQNSYAIQRLNFLFKVIENKRLFDNDFTDDCLTEIQETLKRPTDETE